MAAITRLHPYQNRTIASALGAFLFDAQHRRGLSANIPSFCRCNPVATGAATAPIILLITLKLNAMIRNSPTK